MIHHVRLSRLPEGLEFPSALKDRVWYDESQQQLVFDGFMSKAVFDRLEGLDADTDYQLALEELFRKAVPERQPSRSSKRVMLGVVTGIALVLASTVGICLWYVR